MTADPEAREALREALYDVWPGLLASSVRMVMEAYDRRLAALPDSGAGREPTYIEVRTTACRAGSDGDCVWTDCPQNRDGEPVATGRHCPLDSLPPDSGAGREGLERRQSTWNRSARPPQSGERRSGSDRRRTR